MSRTQEVRPYFGADEHHRSHSRQSRKTSSDGCDCSQQSEKLGSSKRILVNVAAAKSEIAEWFSVHWITLIYSTTSFALLVILLYFSFFAATMDDGSEPDFLSCRSWGYGTSCGLWGVDCRPFESDWFAFRCPARCTLDQSTSLAVFGSGPYRADSRICRAAVHAGVIGSNGGCGFYRFAGTARAFYSSTAHEVRTTEFLSWFPKTIEFQAAASSYCTDLSWWILAVGVIATAGLAFLPRCKPAFMFYSLVAWGFFYVRLVGQPSSQNYVGITINSFGEVMILLATSSVAYRAAVVDTFEGWASMPLKRRVLMWSVCYVLPYHVMINMNLIGYLPWLNIDLGGYEPIHANAGTYVVFTLVGCGILYLAFVLFKNLYCGGMWKRFLMLYGLVVVWVIVSWSLKPSTRFHLHHAMAGALIIPITGFPIPAAACSQAIAVGCFVQGYSRWGWSSYLDTIPTYLTITVPKTSPNTTNVTSSSVEVTWHAMDSVEAYSLRLNRVEVYRGLDTSTTISNLEPNITYFLAVAGVKSWGTDGRVGPTSNFTTLNSTASLSEV